MARPRIATTDKDRIVTLQVPAHLYAQLEEFHDRECRQNFSDSMRDLLSKGLKTYWLTEASVEASKARSA